MASNTISESGSSSYTIEVLQFASVAMEYCKLLESPTRLPLSGWIDRMIELLPLLYHYGQKLDAYKAPTSDELDGDDYDFSDEEEIILPTVITEETYTFVRDRLENYIGAYDLFLDAQNGQMESNDLPIAQHLSELLADVYQPLGDLLGIIKERNETALPYAVCRCRRLWQEYWGENCLAILRALHQMRFGEVFHSILKDEDEKNEKNSSHQIL